MLMWQTEIQQLIRGAKEYVDLVSPYNKHTNHLENYLRDALEDNVRVTLIYREEDRHKENEQRRQEVSWLKSRGGDCTSAKVASRQDLHQ